MQWLFHVRHAEPQTSSAREPYAPESLEREGFVHASFLASVAESARLYFPADAKLELLQIDPRRLDSRVDVATTPRGPMPHIHGPIPVDAIRAVHPLSGHEGAGIALSTLPDRVTATRFAFIAFEGMTLLDLVGVYDPLSRIQSMGFDRTSTCEIVGAQSTRVWASDGAAVSVDRARPKLDEFDVVVIPGGPGVNAVMRDHDVIAWLRTFPENRLIASVCSGSLLLATAGRLRGKRATTHATRFGELAALGVTVVSQRVVDSGQVVTAGGVTSGIDLGLHLVRRLEDGDVADKVAQQMEWRPAPEGG